MTAPRNTTSAPRRRPQRSQRQGIKSDSCSEAAAAPTCATGHAGRRPAAPPVGSAPPSGSRRGLRRGRAAGKHASAKMANAAGNGSSPGGNAGEPECAWPAYARSVEEAEAEALEAVLSLYKDELKPIGRILRKRVAERILDETGIVGSSVNLDALPEVDAKQVRAICDACELLRVEEEEGGDWSAVFVDRPPTFVDVYNPEDCYDEQLWCGLRTYCESPAGQDMSLPGGRYACAQALIALQLRVLAGYSLGRICHIVQLAISQKKILGYMNGAVVPYARSQSMVKEQCAMYGQPCAGNGSGTGSSSALQIAPLEVARKYMREILESGNGEVPLSNVKRIFRSRFQLELSETSFGYSKLSELLQDVHFRDICTVELQGHGYMVIETGPKGADGVVSLSLADSLPPATMPPCAPMLNRAGYRPSIFEDGPRSVPICADEPLTLDDVGALTEGAPMVLVPTPTASTANGAAAPRWCLSPSKDASDGFVACSVQHTFLQYAVPQTPLPGSRRRSNSVPKDMGRSESPPAEYPQEANIKLASAGGQVLKLQEEGESTADGSGSERFRTLTSYTRSGSSSSIEASGTEAVAVVDRFASQRPTDLASLGYGTLRAMDADDEMGHMTPMGSESARRRVSFCPDEPLGLEEAGIFWGRTPGTTPLPSPAFHAQAATAAGLGKAAEGAQWQPLTPGTLSREGCVVHNTFLHIAPVLPTPVRTGAMRRTLSVPKDVGRSQDTDSEVQQHTRGDSPRGRRMCASPKPSPKPSPIAAMSPAFVPPSPALTASPLYNYSDPVQWRRSLLSASPSPQATLDLASALNNNEHASTGTFSTPPPAQPGSLCSAALQASKQSNPTGRVLRLGDHL